MNSSTHGGLRERLLPDARKAFDVLDIDNKGMIDLRDVRVALRSLGWESTKDEPRQIIYEIENHEGTPREKCRIQDGMHCL